MGCGASKNIAVKDAPVESSAPAAAKPAVIVVAASTPAVQKKAVEPHAAPAGPAAAEDQAISADETPAPVVRAASPAPSIRSVKNEADVKPNNVVEVKATPAPVAAPAKMIIDARPSDSGCESTEDLSQSDKDSLDLAVTGTKISSRIRSAISAASEASGALADSETDDVLNSSAVIAERPSSRGGMAFDMTFEGEQARVRVPARLEKIRTRTRSSEMSIEELQQKLAAADARRQAVEQKLKEKLSKESEKLEKVQQVHAALEPVKKSEVVEKENKALENREANLRSIRDKLRAREEHAKKVRENKRLSGGAAEFAAALAQPLAAAN